MEQPFVKMKLYPRRKGRRGAGTSTDGTVNPKLHRRRWRVSQRDDYVTELSFGYVSDNSPNPLCTDESTLSPPLFSFRYLWKLFFYECFAGKNEVSAPFIPASFGSYLEELVFIENPSLVGPFGAMIRNFSRLRRVILTGTGVFGKIPDGLGGFERITLARNRLTGEIPRSLSKLKKLRALDLSGNGFEGKILDSIGGLPEVLKLDLSFNRFSG